MKYQTFVLFRLNTLPGPFSQLPTAEAPEALIVRDTVKLLFLPAVSQLLQPACRSNLYAYTSIILVFPSSSGFVQRILTVRYHHGLLSPIYAAVTPVVVPVVVPVAVPVPVPVVVIGRAPATAAAAVTVVLVYGVPRVALVVVVRHRGGGELRGEGGTCRSRR